MALSRVRNLSDAVVEPITLERLQAPKKSPNLHYRITVEQGLSNTKEGIEDAIMNLQDITIKYNLKL